MMPARCICRTAPLAAPASAPAALGEAPFDVHGLALDVAEIAEPERIVAELSSAGAAAGNGKRRLRAARREKL
jgi:hypothetical protein